MARYLMFWEMDNTKIPVDRKERAQGWGMLMEMVKQDLDKGTLKDWGATPGESRGFCIAEASEIEVSLMSQRYVPYVRFKTFPVLNVNQMMEMLSALGK